MSDSSMKDSITVLPDSISGDNVSDEIIDALIICRKKVNAKRKHKAKQLPTSTEMKYELSSEDDRFNFTMRISKHNDLPTKFSIILNFEVGLGESIILYRCNGPHGTIFSSDPLHCEMHTHQMCAREWKNNCRSDPKLIKEAATYSTVDEAVLFFCRKCGIEYDKHLFDASCDEGVEQKYEMDLRQLNLGDIMGTGDSCR